MLPRVPDQEVSMASPVVAVLRDARALYAANPSHVPSPEWPEDGQVCVMTAFSHTDGADFWPAVEVLRAAAGDPASLVEWNATHSTDEVMAAFDRAIESVS